jgi:hypothetical protein
MSHVSSLFELLPDHPSLLPAWTRDKGYITSIPRMIAWHPIITTLTGYRLEDRWGPSQSEDGNALRTSHHRNQTFRLMVSRLQLQRSRKAMMWLVLLLMSLFCLVKVLIECLDFRMIIVESRGKWGFESASGCARRVRYTNRLSSFWIDCYHSFGTGFLPLSI